MSNTTQTQTANLIRFASPEAVHQAVHEATVATVADVGYQGLMAFFDGYKVSVDSMKLAA